MTFRLIISKYCNSNEVPFIIFKTMEKKEFIMVIKHFFDGKNTFKIQEWFEEYYKGSARQKQPFGDGLLNTN